MKKTIIIYIVAFILILTIGFWYEKTNRPEKKFISHAEYSCKDGKQIKANYFKGPIIPVKPGEPPMPTGEVRLELSDGRKMTLPQTISASGIRYATKNESVIFWSKGETAFMIENSSETYSDCVARTNNY